LGMSIEEVNTLLGPPSIYRARDCYCKECCTAGLGPGKKVEQQWYMYQSVKEPAIYIGLTFRHGKLLEGWAETISGAIYLK